MTRIDRRRILTGLRARLGILAVIPLLPAAGLVVYDAVLLRRANVEKAVSETQQQVSLAATFYRRRKEISRVVLTALARDPRVVVGAPSVCSDYLASVLEDNETLVDLRVVRNDGVVECGALQSSASQGVDLSLRYGVIHRAIQSDGFALSGFDDGPTPGTPVLFAALPVPPEPGHARVIMATLSLAWVGEFDGALLPADATISMVDDDGRLVAHQPGTESVLGRSVYASSMHQAIARATADGNITAEGIDGQTRLIAFTLLHLGIDQDSLMGGPSYIAIGIPAARVYGASRWELARDIAILFAICCVALAGAWMMSSVIIIRPVRQILAATRRLASGDLTTRAGLPPGDGEIESLAFAFDDMASRLERRQRDAEVAAAALEESEVAFRLLAEHSQDLIWLVLPDGTVRYVSPSSQLLLGYAPDDLIGRKFTEVLHPEDTDRMRADMDDRLARRDAPALVTYRARAHDGVYRWLEASTQAIVGGDGTISQIQMTSRDVTARVDAERERNRLEVQLRQAQKLESIGQLAAGIAHEINTPTQYIGDNLRFLADSFTAVQPILRHCEALVEPTMSDGARAQTISELAPIVGGADLPYLTSEVPNAIAQALEGVGSVSRIVAAMKEFSHPGNEEKRPVDLNHAVQNTLTVATNEWKYVADVVTDLDARLPLVPALAGQLNQVLLNLIVNAAHAIGDPVNPRRGVLGRISISTRVVDGCAELRIGDTGGGIPVAIRSRIFDPFFTTKAVGSGTGQGLAVCHTVVVERHGGTIAFETEEGAGTTFIVRLPLSFDTRAVATDSDVRPLGRVA